MRGLAIKNILFFLLIFFFKNQSVFAQTRDSLVFQKINHENGLSDNNVQCVYKDKNGFMWIGTSSGLNLIDGSEISVFKNIPDDTNSISNNFIKCITSDSSGVLWIGTKKGLNSFDPFLRKFLFIPLHNTANSTHAEINNIVVDKSNNLFIATMNGLFFYDRKRNEISFKELPGKGYERALNNTINKVAIDKKGIVWLACFNGLWSYDEHQQKFTHEISRSNDPEFASLITDLIIGHDGLLWIATWDKGLKTFDPSTKKIATYHPTSNAVTVLNFIAEIKLPEGGYKICLNGIDNEFDPSQKKFISAVPEPSSEKNGKVNTIFSSNDSRLWLGTNNGLYFCNLLRTFIIHRRFITPITHQGISMLQWNNKILVTGEGNHFLRAYNANLDETDDFSKNIRNGISCLSLRSAGKGRIIAGTSEGIADINLQTGKMHFITLPNSSKRSNTVNFITNLLQDNNGSWWVFPWRNGIWKADSLFNDPRPVFQNFLSPYDVPKPLVISDAIEDKNANIWMGDLDEGVILYNRKSNEFSKPFIKQLGEKSMAAQIIYSHGTCYSFNGSKILEWNVDSQHLRKINLPPQIDKQINAVALDSIGNLWIASMNGLVSYSLKTKTFHLFTTADGLLNNEMDGALYCRSNGNIVYACTNYISAFDPQKMLASINKIPKITLSEVVVNGNPYRFNISSAPDFDYNTNNFIFKWTVADFTNPLNNRYYYQLQGIDKDWRSVGNTGKVEFANLSYGSYTLLLRGENSNGISANKILKLQFQINPPFWKTWWYLSLIFCSIIAFFYYLYRYRLRQILKIEKLRNKISLDLHDDIGSTLSSISILSEIALHHKKDQNEENMLMEIKESSIAMMERMDDIVWSINPRNDSLANLFLRVQIFASKLFEAKEINYKIQISEDIQNIHVKMEYRQHIYLIMKEAINNLVKYSGCHEAQINVTYNAPLLTIVIQDNGKGCDFNKSTYGNGFNSMKNRAKEIKAQLEIESNINEGTTVILKTRIKNRNAYSSHYWHKKKYE